MEGDMEGDMEWDMEEDMEGDMVNYPMFLLLLSTWPSKFEIWLQWQCLSNRASI